MKRERHWTQSCPPLALSYTIGMALSMRQTDNIHIFLTNTFKTDDDGVML